MARREDILLYDRRFFGDNEEHEFIMDFNDGMATLADGENPDYKGEPFVLIYPKLKEVKCDKGLISMVRECIGDDIFYHYNLNYHDVAMALGKVVSCTQLSTYQ